MLANIPRERALAIAKRIDLIGQHSRFLVASHDPTDPRFDADRYWRGPAWLIINYLLADGLRQADEQAMAERIVASSLELIDSGGFAEYHDPITGDPCGGASFTWTAAMVMEFLAPGRTASN